MIDALTGHLIRKTDAISIYPNSHYVTPRKDLANIIAEIQTDLGKRLRELKEANKLVEMQRLEQRTMQDIETLEQLGFCPGIENYSRYLSGAKPGEPPPCLLDYFPPEYLTIIDESHITVPQIKSMHRGDRSRKENLVNFGFRLPAALDNRPLDFDEFLAKSKQILYVSATPGSYELEACKKHITEQIIRPTGLIDPPIFIRDANTQVDDLLGEIKKTAARQGRVLITTLTKKMSEDLSKYYAELGIRIRYLHSEINTLDRAALLRDLRQGSFDVLVGINLLREGLDLPEVELVAIMDADKEGFLRSRSSLIQTVGRAARNSNAKVIFYATATTDSMRAAIDETNRRREIQAAFNQANGITPQTIVKSLPLDLMALHQMQDLGLMAKSKDPEDPLNRLAKLGIKSPQDLEKAIATKLKIMKKHAAKMEFEEAAQARDEANELKALLLFYGGE